jgi:hypothetical protein
MNCLFLLFFSPTKDRPSRGVLLRSGFPARSADFLFRRQMKWSFVGWRLETHLAACGAAVEFSTSLKVWGFLKMCLQVQSPLRTPRAGPFPFGPSRRPRITTMHASKTSSATVAHAMDYCLGAFLGGRAVDAAHFGATTRCAGVCAPVFVCCVKKVFCGNCSTPGADTTPKCHREVQGGRQRAETRL